MFVWGHVWGHVLQVKELLQANKPVRDAEWTAKEVRHDHVTLQLGLAAQPLFPYGDMHLGS
jgi:hypothetical protein